MKCKQLWLYVSHFEKYLLIQMLIRDQLSIGRFIFFKYLQAFQELFRTTNYELN